MLAEGGKQTTMSSKVSIAPDATGQWPVTIATTPSGSVIVASSSMKGVRRGQVVTEINGLSSEVFSKEHVASLLTKARELELTLQDHESGASNQDEPATQQGQLQHGMQRGQIPAPPRTVDFSPLQESANHLAPSHEDHSQDTRLSSPTPSTPTPTTSALAPSQDSTAQSSRNASVSTDEQQQQKQQQQQKPPSPQRGVRRSRGGHSSKRKLPGVPPGAPGAGRSSARAGSAAPSSARSSKMQSSARSTAERVPDRRRSPPPRHRRVHPTHVSIHSPSTTAVVAPPATAATSAATSTEGGAFATPDLARRSGEQDRRGIASESPPPVFASPIVSDQVITPMIQPIAPDAQGGTGHFDFDADDASHRDQWVLSIQSLTLITPNRHGCTEE